MTAARETTSSPSARDVLRVALRLMRTITGDAAPQHMMGELLVGMREIIPSDYAGIMVLGEDGTFTLPRTDPPVDISSFQVKDYAGGAWLDRGTREVVRFGADEVRAGFPVQWALWQELGVASACSLPLVLHDRVIGGIALWSRRPDAYANVDPTMAARLGHAAAVVFDSARSHANLRLLRDEAADANATLLADHRSRGPGLVGDSPAFQKVLEQIDLVGATASTVLLTGESGTGKELVARAIHEVSPRRDRPFVTINCAALPPSLAESELFGHEEGAFTGATRRRKGRFEMAHEGTLFLDEVGELAPEVQAKLLRAIQQREFERVGGGETVEVDVRIIAATNQDLQRMVAERRFREDLYYRLSVFPLALPPLRERRQDIAPLAECFVAAASARMRVGPRRLGAAALERLAQYDWPGNVRELQNAIDRAVIVAAGEVLSADDLLPPGLLQARGAAPAAPAVPPPSLEDRDRELRDEYRAVLEECKWVIEGPTGAGARLGVHPNTLRYRLKRLGLSRPAR